MQLNQLCRKVSFFTATLLMLSISAFASGQPPYFLADNNGMVGVWDSQNSLWIHETSIPISTFSKYDQALLEKGIALYSQEEIAGAMEDFCS